MRILRDMVTIGIIPAVLCWRLNMTYQYDNKSEKILGLNPAAKSNTVKTLINNYSGMLSRLFRRNRIDDHKLKPSNA